MSDNIQVPSLLDTTMREGEQTPGVRFSLHQKQRIFDSLARFGTNYIEVGHPSVSPDIIHDIKSIVKYKADMINQGRSEYDIPLIAHARLLESDLNDALACGVDGIGFFYCVSDERLNGVFKRDMNQVEEQINYVVGLAKDADLEFIRYTPEDTVRSENENVLRAVSTALDAGANVISVADTTAYMEPHSIYNYISNLRNGIGNREYQLAVHCHNDLGLAVANSIAAYRAGTNIIDVTSLGIGERAGIAKLHEICAVLYSKYNVIDRWNLPEIIELSRMISEFTGIQIPENEPIIGANARLHCAGGHTSALLHDPRHYSNLTLNAFGIIEETVIDHMSGDGSIQIFARDNNFGKLTKAQRNFILERVKTRDQSVSKTEFGRLVRASEREGLHENE